ncbi:MAG: HAD family hydrolase [Clostridia bacterium]|nr:HAD family hydrolase [Clostridia bacterium]
MKYRHVIWDWNGTLLDDIQASYEAVNDMLKMYEKPLITLEQYYSYVDTPIYKFYEHIFDLSVITMDIIKPLYGRFYLEKENQIKLACGAEKLLLRLKEKGVKQYILSAAHTDDLTKQAKRLGVYEFFDEISASGDYEAGSKIERAKALFERENIDRAECVMIGDTLHDVDTAESLGIDCLLYSKGHTDSATLIETGKTVCSSFEDIEKYLF